MFAKYFMDDPGDSDTTVNAEKALKKEIYRLRKVFAAVVECGDWEDDLRDAQDVVYRHMYGSEVINSIERMNTHHFDLLNRMGKECIKCKELDNYKAQLMALLKDTKELEENHEFEKAELYKTIVRITDGTKIRDLHAQNCFLTAELKNTKADHVAIIQNLKEENAKELRDHCEKLQTGFKTVIQAHESLIEHQKKTIERLENVLTTNNTQPSKKVKREY
jgi:hypothetical protein